jgi:hypothetical protein
MAECSGILFSFLPSLDLLSLKQMSFCYGLIRLQVTERTFANECKFWAFLKRWRVLFPFMEPKWKWSWVCKSLALSPSLFVYSVFFPGWRCRTT